MQAILFPGQGSQVVGMGVEFYKNYEIVKNGFYLVGGLTANRFSCSRCIQYKGNNDVGKTTPYRQKSFHNDARVSHEFHSHEQSVCHQKDRSAQMLHSL